MFMGTDEEGFQIAKDEFVSGTLKDELLTYAIAKNEKITFTDKEYENELARLLEESDYTEETFKEDYGMTIREYADGNGWKFSMFKEKVMDKIMSLGTEVSQDEFDNFYETEVEVEAEVPED